MKKAVLFIIIVLFAGATFAQQKEKIKRNAQIMVDAYTKEDFVVLLNYTYPRALELAGGRIAMLKVINTSFAQMKSQGVSIKGASIGQPGEIVRLGRRWFSLVPQTVMMNVKGGSVSAQSAMLAVSEDKGDHWYFINSGTMKDEVIFRFFPELKGKMELPKQREPVFTADN